MLLSTSSSSGPPLGLLSCGSLPPFPQVSSSSVCTRCSARGNLFCEKLQFANTNTNTTARQWRCVFCHTWNATLAVFEQANEFAYSSYEVSSSSFSSSSAAAASAAAATAASASNHHAILVIDETLPSRELVALASALQSVLAVLPDDFYLGLVAFSRSVRVFELGGGGASRGIPHSCEVFTGRESPAVEDVRQLAKHERESSSGGGSTFVSPLYVCRQLACDTLRLLAASALAREQQQEEDDEEEEERCLGPALEFAFNLVKIHDAAHSAVVCCTAGRGTIGPGRWKLLLSAAATDSAAAAAAATTTPAQQLLHGEHALACDYFHGIVASSFSSSASASAITHVFASGPSVDFGLPALLALTPHVHLASAAEHYTLLHALAPHSAPPAPPRIDFIASHSIQPLHVCGGGGGGGGSSSPGKPPVVVAAEELHPAADGGGPAAPRMWHFAPSASLAVFLGPTTVTATTSNTPETTTAATAVEDAYVQWIAYEQGRERVGTEHISSFGAVHEEACAVLIAKRAVAIALSGASSLLAKQHVRNELYNLSRCLPPAQFERIALPLFHLYRAGPLLSNGPGSQYGQDDVALARERFLHHTDFAAAMLMMMPKLVAVRRGQPDAIDMPLSTLSLESDACLVMDQYSLVVVWLGNDVSSPHERARAVELAHQYAAPSRRFPACAVVQCEENSHQAAWLRCRLSPEHKSVTASGGGGGMSQHLVSKLFALPSDDLTYAKFIKRVLEGEEEEE